MRRPGWYIEIERRQEKGKTVAEDIRDDVQESQFPDKSGQSWGYTTYRSQGVWRWAASTLSPKQPETEEVGMYSSREEADAAARRWIEQQDASAADRE